jgi:hypothetical protein
MREYHHNWRTLAGSPNLLFISFEQVVNRYTETIRRISDFYELQIVNPIQELPKARYTGVGGKNSTDLTKTRCPDFKFNPYSPRKRMRRVIEERLFFRADGSSYL